MTTQTPSTLTQILQSPAALYATMGIAAVFILLAFYSTITTRGRASDRMRLAAANYGRTSNRRDLLKSPDRMPEGVLKALIPADRAERTQTRNQLLRAGFDGPNVVRNFFLLRLVLATAAPLIAFVVTLLDQSVGIGGAIGRWIDSLGFIAVSQIVTVSVAVGFWTPTIWLNRRIKARRAEIEAGFPNALDLLQISTEAGMGFDAAMSRVGQSLSNVSPAISEEFLLCQAEILASRERKQAMMDMAERMGVAEVTAFVQVVNQSMTYGTSIARALNAYAAEMREAREMKAMEKANRLPVQMSGVMSVMMLPALFLITLGPTVIRYLQVFGQ